MSGINRRDWLRLGAAGLCGAALPGRAAWAQAPVAKAKRVVFLFQAGGPSQLESFDPKPGLAVSVIAVPSHTLVSGLIVSGGEKTVTAIVFEA